MLCTLWFRLLCCAFEFIVISRYMQHYRIHCCICWCICNFGRYFDCCCIPIGDVFTPLRDVLIVSRPWGTTSVVSRGIVPSVTSCNVYLESLWEKSIVLRKTCGLQSYVWSVPWKGMNKEALSLIYIHLTLSSSHEGERETKEER